MGKERSYAEKGRGDSAERKFFAKYIDPSVKFIHEHAPWLTEDMLSLGALIGIALTSKIAIHYHRQPHENLWGNVGLASVSGASYAVDIFDGATARLRKDLGEHGGFDIADYLRSLFPSIPEGVVEDLLDSGCDRGKDVSMALARAEIQGNKGDRLGEFFAYTAAITAVWPSIARAIAEKRGIQIVESGRNLLGKAGASEGRAVTSIFATAFPTVGKFPLATILDASSTFANIYLATDRLHQAFFEQGHETVSDKKRQLAAPRTVFLSSIAAATMTATYLTYQHLHPDSLQQEVNREVL